MRGTQLIGVGIGNEVAVDPVTNKLTPLMGNQYVSDISMASMPLRKLNLLMPPVPAKLLEIHVMVGAFTGQTTNALKFGFQIFDYRTGGGPVPPLAVFVNPVPMTLPGALQNWTKVFDSTYSSASTPTILPGQYLQMEFSGFNGAKTSTNNFGCSPFFRCLVAS